MSRPPSLRRRLRRRWKHRPGVLPWLFAAPQRLAFLLLRLLPDRAVLGLADRLGRLIWQSGRRRRLGRLHLERALPCRTDEERDLILKRSCGHLGRAAAEAMVIWRKHPPSELAQRVRFTAGTAELLDRYRGQGALIIQAHLGSVEMTSTVLAERGFEPGTPMRLPRNHYLAQDLLRSRNSGEAEVLPRQGAAKRMLSRLRAGQAVVLTFDQNAHHKPLFVPWFGHPAATERTPAALALRTGAPVLVAWCVRTGASPPYEFGLALLRDRCPRQVAADEELLRLTAAFHCALQEVVLKHPEQYLWIHDRYRSRPQSS